MPGPTVFTAVRICPHLLAHRRDGRRQFQRTVALVREVGFDRVNTAAYSPRPNTPAAVVDDQVQWVVQKVLDVTRCRSGPGVSRTGRMSYS